MATKTTAQYEHPLLQSQQIGTTFVGVYYVESAYVKLTVQKKEFTDMTIRDRSGSRNVKYWGKIDGLAKGQFIRVSANVEDYQGAPSIIAKNVEITEQPEDMSFYIPVYEDAQAYAERYDAVREGIVELEKLTADATCGLILDELLKAGSTFTRFVAVPGSDKPHYGKQGGLLANTVRVAEGCVALAESYNLTQEEMAIAMTAAIIHRIGGVDAYEFVDCMPSVNTKGVLVGVLTFTVIRLSAAIRRATAGLVERRKNKEENVPEMNSDVVYRIMHAVISCDSIGVKPMTKEAVVLASACKTDAEVVSAIDFMSNDLNVTQEFTAFDPNSQRKYYRGKPVTAQPEAAE